MAGPSWHEMQKETALSSSYSTLLPLFWTDYSPNHAHLEQDTSNMQLSQPAWVCNHRNAPSSKCILATTHHYYKATQNSAVGVNDGIHNNHAISQQHECLTTWVIGQGSIQSANQSVHLSITRSSRPGQPNCVQSQDRALSNTPGSGPSDSPLASLSSHTLRRAFPKTLGKS